MKVRGGTGVRGRIGCGRPSSSKMISLVSLALEGAGSSTRSPREGRESQLSKR